MIGVGPDLSCILLDLLFLSFGNYDLAIMIKLIITTIKMIYKIVECTNIHVMSDHADGQLK